MFESKFFTPLKELRRASDIAVLLLLCSSLFVMLAYSVAADSIPMTWAVVSLTLAATSSGYLIANYTRKDDQVEWLNWVGGVVFMGSVLLAAFVEPAWLPFAWLLPLEFLMEWERRYRGRWQTSSILTAAWQWSLIALGLHLTYQVVNGGHWSLWLPAVIFVLACGAGIVGLLHIGIELMRAWLHQRRESRKRERAWKRDKFLIDVLLHIFREFTSQGYYEDLLADHAKHILTKESLLEMLDGSIRGLKGSLDDRCKLERRSAERARLLELRLEKVQQELSQHLVGRVKLGKLVFEILARLRNATAPVDEGTLADWRRDIGFELVASHLLDLHPNVFEAYIADWLVSGAYVKALLRHSQNPVTGYPTIPEEWQHALSAILLANTLTTQDAAPSAPTPALQN